MADNNVNVIQDQDFYGSVRFFGSVTIKNVGSFATNGNISLLTPSYIFFGLANIYHSGAQFEFNPNGGGSVFFISNSLVQTILRMKSGSGSGCSIQFNESPTATNPTLCPDENSLDTGIGSASAGKVSLIAGGLEALTIGKNGTTATTADFAFPLVGLSGLSATPTNLELEGLLGAPDDGTVVIAEDSDNARVIIVVRYNSRWRWMAFANSA